MRSTDIGELAGEAAEFRAKLEELKLLNASPDFAWYPYETLSVFPVLAGMLTGERRRLFSLTGTDSILDVGCGDGALSFFFESCGLRVVAIDNVGTNHSRTAGFRTLAAALNSTVEFMDRDLDAGLSLGSRTFGLAVCLGVLYHLKNPYMLLETLARHARYCLLSTRIAQTTMSGAGIEQEPVAYLLGSREANDDTTNYWIFSEAGLRRILDRTGWKVLDYSTTGYDRGSNPAAGDRDQRAFCLLASKLPDTRLECDLEGGWHAMEDGRWRWTARSFGVRLACARTAASTLRLRFILPEELVKETGVVGLEAVIGGERLPRCEYRSAGEQVYEQTVPTECLRNGVVSVRFELDRAMRPAGKDVRELGVQVVFRSAGGDALRPIALG